MEEMAINFADIKEANGKTIKENNLNKNHNIPLGTLVEVKYDEWHGNGSCQKIHARLWVVSHDRDCDGTPLYALSPDNIKTIKNMKATGLKSLIRIVSGFTEESLTVVEITPELRKGVNALRWED